MVNRREFVQWSAGALPFLGASQAKGLELPFVDAESANHEDPAIPKTNSDVGTLFPFISSQAVARQASRTSPLHAAPL